MAGYLPDEETADAFADGWYRTGDVGWLEPEGWVHLTDRSKEMIKVNGFQVAPAEVEEVLLGHPSVLDCAVFGVADERAGEVPVAAVQLDPARPATTAELQDLVAGSLATYKQVRHVVFVDAVPRLPSGKVLRRTLRDEWTPVLLVAGGTADGRPALCRAAGAGRLGGQGRGRLGPATVRDLDDTGRTGKLDAAVAASGWRELRVSDEEGHPVGVRGRGAIVAEELAGASPTRLSSGRPSPPSCAGWPVRRRPAPPRRWPSTASCSSWRSSPAGLGAVAVDAQGRAALVLVPDGDGHAWPRWPCGPLRCGTDLTRPGADCRAGR